MNSENKYGKITVGYGTVEQKELGITDYLQCYFKDNRIISVSMIEDGSYVVSVENIQSTGRNPQSSIWLSKDSLIGMVSAVMLYFKAKNEDMEVLFKESVASDELTYRTSDNIEVTALNLLD